MVDSFVAVDRNELIDGIEQPVPQHHPRVAWHRERPPTDGRRSGFGRAKQVPLGFG
jgi:hypothetical protein